MSVDRARQALLVRRIGIDTYQEPVIYLRARCPVCRSEGFEAQSRVRVHLGSRSLIATLNVVHSDLLHDDEAGLSESAWHGLAAAAGDRVHVHHLEPLESFSSVRAKIYGQPFLDGQLHAVIQDICAGLYSSLEVTAFLTACAGGRMDLPETVALTQAMVDAGSRLHWATAPVVDKHCVGGLPGNRTTPIVVAIVAACGLTIPKTSSRAITSPSGTADTMEVLAPVDLPLRQMRHVVEREGGCIVWGGAMALSPADDILIRVERPLDFDSDAQLTASVISKKLAAGSTHVLLDLPVGPTAKLRTRAAAEKLGAQLSAVGETLGLTLRILYTDGSQPIGFGIGPALEARDVLAVLRNDAIAPNDLRERAVTLAGHLLELAGKFPAGQGRPQAESVLADGRAWRKFAAICEAQGGMRELPHASFTHVLSAPHDGTVVAIDSRRLARIAKLAGAPLAAAAGLELHVKLGAHVEARQPLYTLHAHTPGELAYARAYVDAHSDVVQVLGDS